MSYRLTSRPACASALRNGVLGAASAAALALPQAAGAFEANTGNEDLSVRWDNTVRVNVVKRAESQDAAFLANPNYDDGDRNFDDGASFMRFDLLSEFDLVWKKALGFRVSAAGWYDTVYNSDNDNPGFAGGAFPNQTSVAFNEFTRKTRDLHGRKVELRDAFVFGRADLGGMPLTVRLGQHALVWGESLFFAANAIAGGQSAFDIGRLLADPTAQTKEFVLPVPQVSAQVQVSPSLTLAAYAPSPNRLHRPSSIINP